MKLRTKKISQKLFFERSIKIDKPSAVFDKKNKPYISNIRNKMGYLNLNFTISLLASFSRRDQSSIFLMNGVFMCFLTKLKNYLGQKREKHTAF